MGKGLVSLENEWAWERKKSNYRITTNMETLKSLGKKGACIRREDLEEHQLQSGGY